MTKLVIQSLFLGNDLSRMEYYSIKSFLVLGYEFHLYTYNQVKNIPEGTKIKDASKIIPKKDIFTLKSLSLPFLDIWRYKLLYLKGGYCVKNDMIALKRFDFKEPFIFSSERSIQKGEITPNICVLKAPPKSEFYKDAYEKSIAYYLKNKKNYKLKNIRIIKSLIKKYKYEKYVKMPKVFCNLDWWHSKEAFMNIQKYPSKYGINAPSKASMFNGPYTINFWSDRITKKYGLSLNKKYDDNSLWEMMIKYIDLYDKY